MLKAGRNIVTRHLPKTEQTISYAAGDDGDHEAGWWRGKLNANNRSRFLVKTVLGNNLVVDRATGLMWPENWTSGAGNFGIPQAWAAAIAWANALTFAGFTDWRIPNINEILSIVRYNGLDPFVNNIFNNVTPGSYWSATTQPGPGAVNAYGVRFNIADSEALLKTNPAGCIVVRDSRL